MNFPFQLLLLLSDPLWRESASRELGESPDLVLASLRRMRKLIYAEKDKEFTRVDDVFLLRFLRAKKFDVDKASKMVSWSCDKDLRLSVKNLQG